MKDHVTKKEFLLEFFGNFGREFGDPNRFFVDNPEDIFSFMEECAKQKKPAFITVQPFYAYGQVLGFEKLFFDFDYGKKSDKFTPKEIEQHTAILKQEVSMFLSHIVNVWKIKPLVVKTRKGYHIYIYFDKVYDVGISKNEDFWKEVYRTLIETFEDSFGELNYSDSTATADVKRFSRIPLSIHQVSGDECIIVDYNLKPTKVRSIEFFKLYGLKEEDLNNAVRITEKNLAEKEKIRKELEKDKKQNWEIKHGFVGKIRPCFEYALSSGEMCHKQRLALLLEAYYSGIQDLEPLINMFKPLNDFDGDKLVGISNCRYQVKWFLKKEVYKRMKPYTCVLMEKEGWCMKGNCALYRRRQGEDPQK